MIITTQLQQQDKYMKNKFPKLQTNLRFLIQQEGIVGWKTHECRTESDYDLSSYNSYKV